MKTSKGRKGVVKERPQGDSQNQGLTGVACAPGVAATAAAAAVCRPRKPQPPQWRS